jgi:hypothetical protein
VPYLKTMVDEGALIHPSLKEKKDVSYSRLMTPSGPLQ